MGKISKADLAFSVLKDIGAVIENDHFVYASGRHGSTYVAHQKIYSHPEAFSLLSSLLAWEFRHQYFDVVLSPASVGRALSEGVQARSTKAIWATKKPNWNGEGNKFELSPEFERELFNSRVLLTDDVVTTGGTLHNLEGLCLSHNARPEAYGCIWNRSDASDGLLKSRHLVALISQPLKDWRANECPLCQEGVPVNTEFGHGKEFLNKQS